MNVLIALLAIFGATYAQIEPFGTEICRLFANGAILRNPGTCDNYITCEDGVSNIIPCEENKFFNKKQGKCDKSLETYCKDPCTTKSPYWEADPKTCNGYFKCISGVGTQGYCSNDLHFDQKQQACIYESESTCKGYNYCDVVPNDVPFNNEENCQMYYMCVKDKLVEYYCDNGLYYDALNGCVDRSLVDCSEHPVPLSTCGSAKNPIREKFVNDGRTCRGYFYCHDMGDNVADPDPGWGQCPEGRFFEYSLQACYPAAAVYCTGDRCDGRNRSKVISGTKGCKHYLICDGDETISEEQCADNMYFDDDLMECTNKRMEYTACS